jgi:hypothetical protein
MPHSPARWTLYGRPESSRLLKVHHYMLHLRIKMGLGAYASSRQDTDYTGGGVVRSSWERPIIRGTAALTSVCIQAHLSRCLTCQVPGPSTLRSSATRAFKAPLRSYGSLGRDWHRNRGFFSGLVRGVSNAREGSKIPTFLFRSRVMCSSFLHLRSSWNVNSANYFAVAISARVTSVQLL